MVIRCCLDCLRRHSADTVGKADPARLQDQQTSVLPSIVYTYCSCSLWRTGRTQRVLETEPRYVTAFFRARSKSL